MNLQKNRRPMKIETKIFFYFLVCKNNYVRVPDSEDFIENMFLMTQNRKKENIFLLTSNQFQVVAAMDCGFCGIPIIKFQSFMQNDF